LSCYFVFDTQIAHRVIQEALTKMPKLTNCRDNNISLSDLLKNYIDVTHTKKHEISAKMRNDDSFWEKRPLTHEMIDYATQDVIYLPLVY
jgi:ribonuclease D